MSGDKKRCLAVIRLRGKVGMAKELEYVFQLVHLNRKNHAILVENTPSNLGQIRKIKDYSTWGEVSDDTVLSLLEKRGILVGGKKLSETYVKTTLGYSSIKELSKDIYDVKIKVDAFPAIQPVFRLHPPRKGFSKSIRHPYPEGELGYRGTSINQLIARMV